MCGRAHLSSDVSEIKLVFSIPPHRPTPNFAASWNAAPTDLLLVVHYDETIDRALTLTTETPDYDGRQALANAHKALDNEDWPEWRFDS